MDDWKGYAAIVISLLTLALYIKTYWRTTQRDTIKDLREEIERLQDTNRELREDNRRLERDNFRLLRLNAQLDRDNK